ncbi:type II toxin-antitoxin system Phd/YefM family antitoxin [Phytomonospora sp. NPDC050363]|uniref:type II toxin-antitoxin system Phd/YefM family antitoxin n=1 Tax=Phytomonospora sp. NPDC050363 TaxID=3155642 RepID=UPI0033C1F61F
MAARNLEPGPASIPLREARIRFTQLVSLAELNNSTTVVTRDGDPRPIAAIVPASALRAQHAAPPPDADWRATVNAGWANRLQTLREQLTGRHHAERRVLLDALAKAWEELDRLARPGSDRDIESLRAAQAHLLGR